MTRTICILILTALALRAQPADSWPTYNGDYSGRRFSPLTQLNTANVQHISLAWVSRVTNGASGHGVRISATPLMVAVLPRIEGRHAAYG
jgi:glucose dehydrogenase